MDIFYWTFTYAAYFILGLTVLIGYSNYGRIDNGFKSLLWYLTAVSFVQLLGWYFAFRGYSNFMLYPFYVSAELLLIGVFLVKMLCLPLKLNRAILLISVAVFSEGIFKAASADTLYIGKSISHLLIVSGAGYYLYQQLLQNPSSENRLYVFLIGSLMAYFAMSMVLFFFVFDLQKLNIKSAYLIWGIHNILLSCFYLSCFIYFFMKWRLK